jgi:hypothetical protein
LVPTSPPFIPGRLFPVACSCLRQVRTASTSARVIASIGFVSSRIVVPFAAEDFGTAQHGNQDLHFAASAAPAGGNLDVSLRHTRHCEEGEDSCL